MLKSYKVHAEQIESVAKMMRDLYHSPRIGSAPPGGKSRAGTGVKCTAGAQKTTHFHARRDLNDSPDTCATQGHPHDCSGSGVPESGRPPLPAIRCFRCGDGFPVTDFYYTKKSGLCIPCWEAKVI